MWGLPTTTECYKRIPKRKCLERTAGAPADLRRAFDAQIREIRWTHKLAASTLNVAPGNDVQEIDVLEIRLRGREIDDSVLMLLEKAIPRQLIFVLAFGDERQIRIGCKETSADDAKTRFIGNHFRTEWMPDTEIRLPVEGLSMDTVYADLVRRIGGNALNPIGAEPLKKSVERDLEQRRLRERIAALENKIHKEKQLNRQVEMNAELKNLKKEIGDISVNEPRRNS